MMLRPLLSFFLALGSFQATTLWGLHLEVSAPSAVLVRAADGRPLWSKGENVRRPPASLTKIATAWWILRQYGDRLEELVPIQAGALVMLSRAERERSNPWARESGDLNIELRAGEILTVRSLLEGMLLRSAGDAANALAWHFGKGSISSFMEELNRGLQQELGLRDTQFLNPHGHEHRDHYSTAADLARMAVAASKDPEFNRIVAQPSYQRPATELHNGQRLRSTNPLLWPGPYFHPHAKGMKTGYTTKAGACLIASADNGTRSVIYVSLASHGPSRWNDARHAIDLAFQEKPAMRTYHLGGLIGKPRAIHGGRHPVQGMLIHPLRIARFPSEERAVSLEINWDTNLRPPIFREQALGVVRLIDEGGEVLAEATLAAAADVPATWTYSMSNLWKHWGWKGQVALLGSLFLSIAVWLWALLYCSKRETATTRATDPS